MDDASEGKLIRILYLVIFYVIYSFTELLLLGITIIQTLLNLFTGEPSNTLREFGSSLGQYVKQIAAFLSYSSNTKPYPFSDWPAPDLPPASVSAAQDVAATEHQKSGSE